MESLILQCLISYDELATKLKEAEKEAHDRKRKFREKCTEAHKNAYSEAKKVVRLYQAAHETKALRSGKVELGRFVLDFLQQQRETSERSVETANELHRPFLHPEKKSPQVRPPCKCISLLGVQGII